MKKLLFTFLLLIIFAGSIQAQRYRTSFDLILRGNYSVWLSDSLWKDNYSGFPGVQLDAVVNFSPMWSAFAGFGVDFIAPKEKTITTIGATFEEENSTQITVYAGPRFNINIPDNRNLKFYIDVAGGLYSLNPGDVKRTLTTNPPSDTTFSFNSASQFGFNAGAGMNVFVSPQVLINVGLRYHNVPKKEDHEFSPGVKGTLNERSYFQFGAGIGVRLN
jgi:opacity protein-like surface antigen